MSAFKALAWYFEILLRKSLAFDGLGRREVEDIFVVDKEGLLEGLLEVLPRKLENFF